VVDVAGFLALAVAAVVERIGSRRSAMSGLHCSHSPQRPQLDFAEVARAEIQFLERGTAVVDSLHAAAQAEEGSESASSGRHYSAGCAFEA
jgi:hypothetical protein